MDLSVYLQAIWRRRKIPFAFGTIALLVAMLSTFVLSAAPRAKASVLLFTPDATTGPPGAFLQQQVDAYVGLADSETVLNNQVRKDAAVTAPLSKLRKDLHVTAAEGGSVNIVYSNANKKKAEQVVNSAVKESTNAFQENRRAAFQNVSKTIEDDIGQLTPQLDAADTEIADYMRSTGIYDPDQQRNDSLSVLENLQVRRADNIINGKGPETSTTDALIAQQQAALQTLNDNLNNLKALQRKRDTLEARLQTLQTQLDEARKKELDALNVVQVQTVSEPTLMETKFTSTGLRWVLAGMLGFVLGAIVALVLDLLDKSVRSVDEAEQIIGYRVIAQIPSFSMDDFFNPPPERAPPKAEKVQVGT